MARSLKKGPFVHPSIVKHMGRIRPGSSAIIRTWSRASAITPEMVGYRFGVHNGRSFIEFSVSEDMVGHHLGEFAPTRKFTRHGGKMQKELEAKTAEAAKPAPKENKK